MAVETWVGRLRESNMGRCYAFECPRCQYVAHVAGGEDGGRDCVTRTLHCLDCRQLFEAVTHLRRPTGLPLSWRPLGRRLDPSFCLRLSLPSHATLSLLIRKPSVRLLDRVLPSAHDVRWVELETECPRDRHHRVEPWTSPGRCPSCGTFLEKTQTPYRIWD